MAEARSVDNLSGREMAEFHEAFSLFDKDGTCFRFFFSDFFQGAIKHRESAESGKRQPSSTHASHPTHCPRRTPIREVVPHANVPADASPNAP